MLLVLIRIPAGLVQTFYQWTNIGQFDSSFARKHQAVYLTTCDGLGPRLCLRKQRYTNLFRSRALKFPSTLSPFSSLDRYFPILAPVNRKLASDILWNIIRKYFDIYTKFFQMLVFSCRCSYVIALKLNFSAQLLQEGCMLFAFWITKCLYFLYLRF